LYIWNAVSKDDTVAYTVLSYEREKSHQFENSCIEVHIDTKNAKWVNTNTFKSATIECELHIFTLRWLWITQIDPCL